MCIVLVVMGNTQVTELFTLQKKKWLKHEYWETTARKEVRAEQYEQSTPTIGE